MFNSKKSIVFCALLILFFPIKVAGESNFDYFFKDSSQYQDVVVIAVKSTDTIVLKEKIGEANEVIKLIGLRAPVTPDIQKDVERDQYGFTKKQPISPLTTVEESSFDYVKNLLEGKHVRLEFDADKVSEDHATLAYVFLLDNNVFVNSEILRQGCAHLSIRPPNTKYSKELRDAYKEARSEKRGLQGQ